MHCFKMKGFFRVFFGFILGFCTNFLLNLYQETESIDKFDKEKVCADFIKERKEDQADENLMNDLNIQLPESYRPRDMYDVLRFEYLNRRYIYSNLDDEPKIHLLGHQKNDLFGIAREVFTLFKHQNPGDWKLREVVQMYRRLDPQRGKEYSLTLNLSRSHDHETNNAVYQFEVVKPFSSAILLEQRVLNTKTRIYIIVPVFNSTQKFVKFLARFEKVCLKNQAAVVLVVVSFLRDRNVENDIVGQRIKALSSKYGNRYFTYVHTFRPFARAFAINLAIKSLPDDKLLFFCDLDIAFNSDFLHRCRTNTIYNKQVFYPIVFAQYHPKMVKAYSPTTESGNLVDINKSTGHWVHYGYGIACMYAHDYRRVGGFDLSTRGWGGEDVMLFKKHVRSDLKVFRSMDPGLLHIYHDKTCDPSVLTADQHRMCQDARAQGLASRVQASKHILSKNCSISSL